MKKGLLFYLLLSLFCVALVKASSSAKDLRKGLEEEKRILKASTEKKSNSNKNNFIKSRKGENKEKSGYKSKSTNRNKDKGKSKGEDVSREEENGMDGDSITNVDAIGSSGSSPGIGTPTSINRIQPLSNYSVASSVEIVDAPAAINTVAFSNVRLNKEAAEIEDLNDSMKALAEQEANERIKKVEEDSDMGTGHFTLKHYIVFGMTIFFLFTAYSLHRRYRITLFSDRAETKMQQQDIEITSNEEVNPFLDKS